VGTIPWRQGLTQELWQLSTAWEGRCGWDPEAGAVEAQTVGRGSDQL
jgi:hypothetical protein